MIVPDCSADDPRVARSRSAVLSAALELIARRGIADTSVEAIADEAGVAKTTIYRHWTSKPEVVLDALAAVVARPEDPDTGTLRGDLQELLGGLVDLLDDERLGRLLTAIIDAAERDPELAALQRSEVSIRHRVVRDVISRGIERGELPVGTDPDEVLTLLSGPVFYRRIVSHGEVDRAFAHGLVDRVLAAFRAEPG